MNPVRIMVVEDEGPVGLDIQLSLEDQGYIVTSVNSDAQQALDRMEQEKPDLILMDIHLRGDMDGIDAAQDIHDRLDIPVLFLTAFANTETILRARSAGAYGYLVKPFESRELQAMIEIALCRQRSDHERRELDDRIRQAQKLESLRTMAGGIAHQFNNALHAVLGNLTLALEEIPPDSPTHTLLLDAKLAAHKAAESSKQMLACSGHGFARPEALDPNTLVQQIKPLMDGLLPSAVILNFDLKDELPNANVDPSQLKQAILALITNAIEAIDGNPGEITIRTSALKCDEKYLTSLHPNDTLEEGLFVSLEIVDTGCGMDNETVRKMFDPYFSTKFTGRGLGLAATLGIIASHRGALDVSSEPGKGTNVRILLPAHHADPEQSSEAPDTPALTRARGTVLFVDDEKAVRVLGKAILETAGYTPLMAADGQEAVEVFREHANEIDYVLLDLTMPRKNGGEVFREIRQMKPDVRVILSSGYSEEVARSRCLETGLAGFIQKPYGVSDLMAKLREVVEA